MKKIFSVIIAFFLLMFGINVSANIYDALYKFDHEFSDEGAVSMDIQLCNYGDLSFLSCLNEYIKPYDASKIADGLSKSQLHLDINYQTRKNHRIIKSYIKAYLNAPLWLNDELYVDAKAVFNIWANIDSTDSENPQYYFVIKLPTYEKYIIFDSKYADKVSFYPIYLKTYTLKEAVETALRHNSRLVSSENNYTLSMNDEDLKGFIASIADYSYESLYSVFNGKTFNSRIIKECELNLKDSLKRLENIGILGKNGLKRTISFSEDGIMNESNLSVSFDTNIFKLYYAYTGKEMPVDPNVPKPAINADNSDVKIDIDIRCTYFFNPCPVEFPLLTDENSYDVYKNASYSLTYTTDDVQLSPYETVNITYDGFMVNNGICPYAPLRAVLNGLGIDNDSIFWNEGNIHIISDSGMPFNFVSVTEGSRIVTIDGTSIELNAPPMTIESIMYVPESFLTNILGVRVLGYSTIYSYEKNCYQSSIRIEHIKPLYIGIGDNAFGE